jgi:chromosome segregation ATPase
MLDDPNSPDKEIAPLVSSWTAQLISKAEALEKASKAKDTELSNLDLETDELQNRITNLQTKNKELKSRVSHLEPANNELREEITALRENVSQISARSNTDKDKVERLNAQLASLYRKSAAEKRGFGVEIVKLQAELAKSQAVIAKSQGTSVSPVTNVTFVQPLMNGVKHEGVKKKYEDLEGLAREVLRVCGMMASDNFGELGVALLKLKKFME